MGLVVAKADPLCSTIRLTPLISMRYVRSVFLIFSVACSVHSLLQNASNTCAVHRTAARTGNATTATDVSAALSAARTHRPLSHRFLGTRAGAA